MKKNIKYFLPLFVFLGYYSCFAQQTEIDSLKNLLKVAKEDTNKVKVLNRIAALYSYNKPDSCFIYAQLAYSLSTHLNFENGNINSMRYLISAYRTRGDLPKALELSFKLLEYAKKVNNKTGVASAFHSLASIKDNLGNLKESIEYNLKALKIREELGDSLRISHSYVNLSIVYDADKQFEKSIEAAKNAYTIQLKMKNHVGAMYSLMNMGRAYTNMGYIDTANSHYIKAYELYKTDPDRDKSIGSSIYRAMARIYLDNKELSTALSFSEIALQLAIETQYANAIGACYDDLAVIYYEMKDYKHSLEYYQKSWHLKDSLFNSEKTTKALAIEAKYKTEQEEKIRQLEEKAKGEKHNAELKQRNIIIYSSVAGLALALVFAGFIFRNYKQKQKANKELAEKNILIEQQKKVVEEKNKDITDSINYAKRIQEAILPAKEIKYKIFPEAFVLFHPKDVVSGDFYWFAEKNSKRIISAVDCTGHGVPGAFMSMVGNAFLNEIVNERGITEPGLILSELRHLVIKALKQKEEMGGQKDGMDISLLSFSDNEVEWSGAHNPLLLIRNGKIIEYEADKRPIGFHMGKGLPFTNHKIELQKGDALYIFTDGYADQFGGPKGKKFKYKQFQEMLLSIQNENMMKQEEILLNTFSKWKGDLEQIDDVLVIGIKV